jgi:hypothetical protein
MSKYSAVFGTTVPLYLHTDSKLQDTITEMRKEMKDFHGKLYAIEERGRK